jgi:anion-transporting  ArsA/GET3 family ATPase
LRKILITGALGQIGSELTEEMRKIYGTENVVASSRRIKEGHEKLIESGPFEVLNINDSATLASIVDKYKINTIVNLMSMALKGHKASDKDLEKDEVISILKRRYDKVLAAKKIMMDDHHLSFIFVINAEKLPIDETAKAIKILEKYDVRVSSIIVNKILPDNMQDEFWISKKMQEQKYLNIIKETFKDKKIITLPLLKEDMKANNIGIIADMFADFVKS